MLFYTKAILVHGKSCRASLLLLECTPEYIKTCKRFYHVWVIVNSDVFAKSVKRHICQSKNSQLGHDLSTSVNDLVISHFCEGFSSRDFASANFLRNKTVAKISELYSTVIVP